MIVGPSGKTLNDAIGCWFPGGFGTVGEGEGAGAAATVIGTVQRAWSTPAVTVMDAM